MAIGSSGTTGKNLQRTTNLPSSTFSIYGWAILRTIAAGPTLMALESAAGAAGVYLEQITGGFGVSVDPAGGDVTFTNQPVAGQPFFWALTNAGSGGVCTGYWAPLGVTKIADLNSVTHNPGGTFTPATLTILNDVFDDATDGIVDEVTVLDGVVLTAQQVFQAMLAGRSTELFSDVAVYSKAHLWATGDLTDYGSSNHPWTANGALTSELPIPIPVEVPPRRGAELHVIATVSAALTGQSLTLTEGAMVAANSPPLAGQSLTLTEGTLTVPGGSPALTGQSLTLTEGALTTSRSVPLVGQSLTLTRGTLVPADIPPIGIRRCMPLGDSLTDGTGDPANGGWRNGLFAQFPTLVSVGSLTVNGGHHEGHTGFTSQDIVNGISGWLGLNPPDTVLFMIGTNDADAGTAAATTAANIVSVVNTILAANATAQVFVATIPNEDSTRTTQNANAVLQRAAVSSAIASNFGSTPNVALVSMPTNIPDANFLDGEHPNTAGNVQVQAAWAASIQAMADSLVGVMTLTAGAMAPAVSPPLVGASLTLTGGVLGVTRSAALVGQALTLTQGQLVTGAALGGQVLTLAGGTMVPASSPALIGAALALAGGTMVPASGTPLVGASMTLQAGTLSFSSSPPLVGATLTTTTGQVVAAVSPPLIGASLLFTQGGVGPTTPGQAQLVGQRLTLRQGTLVPNASKLWPTPSFLGAGGM